jgi:glycosyltransferase involved in cell wall biosynthesis
MKPSSHANVCLFLEGTYPFSAGGVSTWTHELIQMQNHLTFSIVTLLREGADTTYRYELPENIVSVTPVFLQKLHKKQVSLPAEQIRQLFNTLEYPLLNLQRQASLGDLQQIILALKGARSKVGRKLLFDSREAWEMLLKMYHNTMKENSFLDYFWSWRTLFGGMYSVLLADLPQADCYHALCTGYAGLFLARAGLETGKPCIVTEHGIYTNERRIEIASADWLDDKKSFTLSVDKTPMHRDLKDLWIDIFSNYSRLCYEASTMVITLFEGNQPFQLMDGADKKKLRVISNGIDYERYAATVKEKNHPQTIALIGRVVPIKDVKNFIKAVGFLHDALPEVEALILGPTDEDPGYYKECLAVVEYLNLSGVIRFTGKVSIEDYLKRIDINVLTSLSEAQPLVILEAGAAGIPTVATDVGACREMVLGKASESPVIGAGGAICPLSSPQLIAAALEKLLTDPDHYKQCSEAIRARVETYYHKNDQYAAYHALYLDLIPSTLKKTG